MNKVVIFNRVEGKSGESTQGSLSNDGSTHKFYNFLQTMLGGNTEESKIKRNNTNERKQLETNPSSSEKNKENNINNDVVDNEDKSDSDDDNDCLDEDKLKTSSENEETDKK